MSIHDSQRGSNPDGLLVRLRQLADGLCQKGCDRNTVFAELVRANANSGRPVPDEAVAELLKGISRSSEPQSVNCEPTVHRLVLRVFLPPPHRPRECLREPTAA